MQLAFYYSRSQLLKLQLKIHLLCQLRTPKNANVFTLVNQLKNEDLHVDNKLRQAAQGIDTEAGRTRTKERLNKWATLKSVVSKYHEINNPPEYIKMILEYYAIDWSFVGI